MLLYIRILLRFYFHHLFVSVLLVVLDVSYMLIFRSLGDHAITIPPAFYCKAETRKQLVKKYQALNSFITTLCTRRPKLEHLSH